MGKTCAFGLCTSSSRKPSSSEYSFVRFPNPRRYPERARRWAYLCGRRNFELCNVTKDSYICSKHFPPDEELDPKMNPTLEPFYALDTEDGKPKKKKSKTNSLGNKKVLAKRVKYIPLYPDDVPEPRGLALIRSIQKPLPLKPVFKTYERRKSAPEGKKNLKIEISSSASSNRRRLLKEWHTYSRPVSPPFLSELIRPTPESAVASITKRTASTSETIGVNVRDDDVVWLKVRMLPLENRIESISVSIRDVILETPKSGRFYTGLTAKQRKAFWTFLGSEKNKLIMIGRRNNKQTTSGQLRISIVDQFLLTLYIIRGGYTFDEVAFRFKMRPHYIEMIFNAWLCFMYRRLAEFKRTMFVKKKDLKISFREEPLRAVRVVIDKKELLIESPKGSHEILKVLIGVAPSGSCVFVSQCFRVSVSDREMIKMSGFLEYLDSGDVILAEPYLNIEDLVAEKGARLLVPPSDPASLFPEGQKQPSILEDPSRIVAKVRVHFEEFNQRLKRFKFCSNLVPRPYISLLSQAILVCSCLTNLHLYKSR